MLKKGKQTSSMPNLNNSLDLSNKNKNSSMMQPANNASSFGKTAGARAS
jgi:hypothetical protein